MTDLTWLSQEADKIHGIFYSLFFTLATVILLVGVVIEYFKFPLTGSANFSRLIGRALIATLLLTSSEFRIFIYIYTFAYQKTYQFFY